MNRQRDNSTTVRRIPATRRRPTSIDRHGGSGRQFFAFFALVLILVSSLYFATPRSANAVVPAAIVQDVPASINRIIDFIRATLKEALKVAADVAVKTSIRLFYRKLASATTDFVMTAGTGQRPLFITSGSFYIDIFDATKNDFIDSLSESYFGVKAKQLTPEAERDLSLLARNIVNAQSSCNQFCQSSYNDSQKDIKSIEDALKPIQITAREHPDEQVACPIVVTVNPPVWSRTETTPFSASRCAAELSSALTARRKIANDVYSACTKACARNKKLLGQIELGTTTFGNIVGNEAVAAAVKDFFSPRNNQLGILLDIVGEAERLAAIAVEQQKTLQQADIGPTTTLAGLVKAPASLAKKRAEQALAEATGDVPVITGSRIADVIGTAFSAALIQRITDAWFNSKCGLNPQACKSPTGTSPASRLLFEGGTTTSGIAAARLVTSQIGRPEFTTGDPSRNTKSVIDDLEIGGFIDHRFRQAIEQQLTVRQAIDQGYLDRDRTFGFDAEGNEPKDGYPFSSIVRLKTARIVPVGWELAAKFTRTPGNASARGLGELVDDYSICGQDAEHDAKPSEVTKTCEGGPNAGVPCADDTDCEDRQSFGPCEASGACRLDPSRPCLIDPDCDAVTPHECKERFSASPFCGLVNPDWVLKAPTSYCRREGAGEELISKIFICDEDTNGDGKVVCNPTTAASMSATPDTGHYQIQRKTEVCADDPSCIAENEDGTCRAYGYCFEEQPIFRFDGTSCPSYYVSCQDYTKPTGETVAYLSKTVDKNGCSSDNAGCLPYCGDRKDSDKSWLCQVDPGETDSATRIAARATCPAGDSCTCRLSTTGEECTVAGGATSCRTPSGPICYLGINYTYFDRDVEECDVSNEGCHEFVDTISPTNLLANSGFEIYRGEVDNDADVDTIRGWGTVTGVIATSEPKLTSDNPGIGEGNTVAVKLPGVAAPGSAGLGFNNELPAAGPQGFDVGRPLKFMSLALSYYGKTTDPAGCRGSFGLRSADGAYTPLEEVADYSTSWTRFSKTYELPDLPYNDADVRTRMIQPFIKSGSRGGTPCDIIVDNVQLEESQGPTDYKNYATVNGVYLKANRRSCNRVDVGCEKYTSIASGESINGVVNAPDRCAAENVGCRAYRKEPIEHLPFRPAQDPINLVASSGKACQASEVGCEEYTNLDEVARGGEGKEYYTSIKQCVKPVSGPSQASYFTWVGDDRSGFQLKQFRLKVSNMVLPGETGNGPCTNLKLAVPADQDNPDCVDTAATAATCTVADLGVNPDCTQYFDSDGHIFYRLQSRTIPVTDECHPYRNTIDERGVCQNSSNDGAPCKDAGDCLGAGATCAPKNNIYHILASQSTKCSAQAAECRAFTGASGAERTIFSDNFERSSVVTNNWKAVSGSVDLSSESVAAGGRSMVAVGQIATQDNPTTNPLKDKLTKNTSYLLSFWAKPDPNPGINVTLQDLFIQLSSGTGDIRYPFVGSVCASGSNVGQACTRDPDCPGSSCTLRPSLPLAKEWHPYTVGPMTISEDPAAFTPQLGINIVDGSGGAAKAFFDNIVLTEVTDSAFLVDNSYRTCPASELGCDAYRDRGNTIHYLKSFTRLCGDEAVGCSALIDTQNSSFPFVGDAVRGVSVPADYTVPLVDEGNASCPASEKGCRAYGRSIFDVNKRVSNVETVYLKDHPDKHTQTLCLAQEIQCEEFTSSDGSKSYFKDPGPQTCEFKKLGGDTDYHWYITDSSVRCPTVTPPKDGIPVGRACVQTCSSGLRQGLACSSGLDCPSKQGTCDTARPIGLFAGTCTDARVGQGCNTNSDCVETGTCGGNVNVVGRPCSSITDCQVCVGGTNDGKPCTGLADCQPGGTCGGNICDLWTGVCPEDQSGCNEYRDPSDPNPCRSTCALELLGGKPVPVDENCQPTNCAGGRNNGGMCRTNNDCPGTCSGGDRDGLDCFSIDDCPGAGASCSNIGACSAIGIPGCRSYTYLRQTVEQTAAQCNGRIDPKLGCRPFNDTSNPTLNFRGQ